MREPRPVSTVIWTAIGLAIVAGLVIVFLLFWAIAAIGNGSFKLP